MTAHVMMRIKPEDLPPRGLKVLFRTGDCFNDAIEWSDTQEGVLLASLDVNDLHEPGIYLKQADLPGYAGFEPRTGTYWRFSQESDPEVYRESCMQLLEISEVFTPLSSHTAWDVQISEATREGIRALFKNSVTGVELSFRINTIGLAYKIKDLGGGRRIKKLMKHDYVLNQSFGTTFKKLDHHQIEAKTHQNTTDSSLRIELHFKREQVSMDYRLTPEQFSLDITTGQNHAAKTVASFEYAYSDVVADTRSFIGPDKD